MSSWSSWLRERRDELREGLNEFTSQLAEDTGEVQREISHKVEAVSGKIDTAQIGKTLRVNASDLGSLSGGASRALASTASKFGQQVERVSNTVMRDLEGVVTQADEVAAGLLTRSSTGLRTGGASGAESSSAAALLSRATGALSGLGGAGAIETNTSRCGGLSEARFRERSRALGAERSLFTNAVADPAAFATWCSGFELLAHTSQIEQLLKEHEGLSATHAALVPEQLSYRAFWQRYFYESHRMQQQEERRLALLRRSAPRKPSLSSWEDSAIDDVPFESLNASRPSRISASKSACSSGRTGPPPPCATCAVGDAQTSSKLRGPVPTAGRPTLSQRRPASGLRAVHKGPAPLGPEPPRSVGGVRLIVPAVSGSSKLDTSTAPSNAEESSAGCSPSSDTAPGSDTARASPSVAVSSRSVVIAPQVPEVPSSTAEPHAAAAAEGDPGLPAADAGEVVEHAISDDSVLEPASLSIVSTTSASDAGSAEPPSATVDAIHVHSSDASGCLPSTSRPPTSASARGAQDGQTCGSDARAAATHAPPSHSEAVEADAASRTPEAKPLADTASRAAFAPDSALNASPDAESQPADACVLGADAPADSCVLGAGAPADACAPGADAPAAGASAAVGLCDSSASSGSDGLLSVDASSIIPGNTEADGSDEHAVKAEVPSSTVAGNGAWDGEHSEGEKGPDGSSETDVFGQGGQKGNVADVANNSSAAAVSEDEAQIGAVGLRGSSTSSGSDGLLSVDASGIIPGNTEADGSDEHALKADANSSTVAGSAAWDGEHSEGDKEPDGTGQPDVIRQDGREGNVAEVANISSAAAVSEDEGDTEHPALPEAPSKDGSSTSATATARSEATTASSEEPRRSAVEEVAACLEGGVRGKCPGLIARDNPRSFSTSAAAVTREGEAGADASERAAASTKSSTATSCIAGHHAPGCSVSYGASSLPMAERPSRAGKAVAHNVLAKKCAAPGPPASTTSSASEFSLIGSAESPSEDASMDEDASIISNGTDHSARTEFSTVEAPPTVSGSLLLQPPPGEEDDDDWGDWE